jgi:hypothetical protein
MTGGGFSGDVTLNVGAGVGIDVTASFVHIADAGVTTAKLADNAVTSAKIATNAVGATEIADNSIDGGEIVNGSLTAVEFANNTITGDKIALNTITTNHIAPDAVQSDEIQDGQVATADLANNAVTNAKIASGAVGSSEIASNAVQSDDIQDGQVMTADLANNAVTNDKIAPAAVGGLEIATNAVQTDEIQDGQVMTADLADSAVTTPKLAGGAVTLDKINTTGAATGQALIYNGATAAWAVVPTTSLGLPFVGSTSSQNDVFAITNAGSGRAGVFQITDTSSPNPALHVMTRGIGPALEITGGAGLAEQFEVGAGPGPTGEESGLAEEPDPADKEALQAPLPPGTVVSIDPANPGRLVVSSRAFDQRVAGIVSGAGGVGPGLLIDQPGTTAAKLYPVALTGRVLCLADAANGPIEPGDLLTTSATPGHAMKSTNPAMAQGAILGKAMTRLAQGRGLVLVLVTLQ